MSFGYKVKGDAGMKGLDVFLAIAMSRTLSDAANVLGLSPSAVSYNLKCLEDSLGLDLVDRKKGFKNIHLTPAGVTLLPLAISYEEVIREISNIRKTPRHQLSIGCVESINHCLFPPFLHSLKGCNLDIKVDTNTSLELHRLTENREVDVAFVVNLIPSTKLNISPFLVDDMRLIRLATGKKADVAVNAQTLDPNFEIYINWSLAFQIWHDHIWSENKRARFQTNSVVHIDSFLLGDDRCWIIAPDSVANFYRNRGFDIQAITPEPPQRTCYKITHHSPTQSISAALEIFNEALDNWRETAIFL